MKVTNNNKHTKKRQKTETQKSALVNMIRKRQTSSAKYQYIEQRNNDVNIKKEVIVTDLKKYIKKIHKLTSSVPDLRRYQTDIDVIQETTWQVHRKRNKKNINERLAYLRVNTKPINLSILNPYETRQIRRAKTNNLLRNWKNTWN